MWVILSRGLGRGLSVDVVEELKDDLLAVGLVLVGGVVRLLVGPAGMRSGTSLRDSTAQRAD